MALATNQKEQMAKRLQADAQILAPEFAVSSTTDANGNPVVLFKSGATVIAEMAIVPRSFNGFQIVAELSSSAAQGLPENEMWLVVKNDQSLATMAKLTKLALSASCSGMKVEVEASVDLSDIGDETKVVLEMPNDARNGFSGR